MRYRFGRDGLEVAGMPAVALVDATADPVVLDLDGVRRRWTVGRFDDRVVVDGPQGSVELRRVPRFTDPSARLPAGALVAPMPGTVVRVAVGRRGRGRRSAADLAGSDEDGARGARAGGRHGDGAAGRRRAAGQPGHQLAVVASRWLSPLRAPTARPLARPSRTGPGRPACGCWRRPSGAWPSTAGRSRRWLHRRRGRHQPGRGAAPLPDPEALILAALEHMFEERAALLDALPTPAAPVPSGCTPW